MSNIGKHEFDFTVVAIDFDGTLISGHTYPQANVQNAITYMVSLVKMLMAEKNIKIILWSCRDKDSDEYAYNNMINFCNYYGLKFDAINDNIKEYKDIGVNCRKIIADMYIDDLTIHPFNAMSNVDIDHDTIDKVEKLREKAMVESLFYKYRRMV